MSLDTWVWSLGQEKSLEEDMAAHSSILSWRIPRTESLQYSCLENLMELRAWQVVIHGVAESWAWLKWLSTHACIYTRVLRCHPPRLLTMVSNTYSSARTPGQETPSPRQIVHASVLARKQLLETAAVLPEQRDRQIWKEVLLSHLLVVWSWGGWPPLRQ